MKRNNITLEQIGKELPFGVPDNYFNQFALQMDAQIGYRKQITHYRFHKSWMYMAAMFVGIVVMSGVFYSKHQQNLIMNSENYESYIMSQVDKSTVMDYYLGNSSSNE